MIKVFPSSLSGTLVPESSHKTLLTLLLASCFSKDNCTICYKGLSDDAMCGIFLLEKLGHTIKINKTTIEVIPNKNIPLTPVELDLRDSQEVAPLFAPTLKSVLPDITFTASERLAETDITPLLNALRKGGCIAEGSRFPLRIKGTLSKKIFLDTFPSSVCDGFYIGSVLNGLEISGIGFSVHVASCLESFKRGEREFHAPSDKIYLALFIASGAKLTTEEDIPSVFKNLTARNMGQVKALDVPFHLDFKKCEEYFIPLLLHAMRIKGRCSFTGLDKENPLTRKTISFLSKFGVKHSYSKNRLEIISDGRVAGGMINTWQNEHLAICACLSSGFSENPVELDSEECILRRYPGFFDDFKKLGGKFTRL